MVEAPLFFILLLASVIAVLFVHELGHLSVARYFVIKVLTINVGFGPQLVTFTDGHGTSWKLRAIPIGGNCIFDDDSNVVQQKRSDLKDAPLVLRKRAMLYAAGPIFNLIFAACVALIVPILCRSCTLGSDEGTAGAIIFRLVAEFSVATALFNLLPLLPLDGGHLCLTAIQAGIGHPVSEQGEKWFFVFSVLFIIAATTASLTWALSAAIW